MLRILAPSTRGSLSIVSSIPANLINEPSVCTSIRVLSTPASSTPPSKAPAERSNCTTPPNTASQASNFGHLRGSVYLGKITSRFGMFARGYWMRAALSWLAIGGLSIAAFVHYGNHIPQLKQLSIFQQSKETDLEGKEAETTPPSASGKTVNMVSPLEQLMEGAKSDKPAEDRAPRNLVPSDLIAPSPVGTGGVILHMTFS